MTIKQFAEEIIRITGTQSGDRVPAAAVDDPKVRQPDITRAKNRAAVGAASGFRRRHPQDDRILPNPLELKVLDSATFSFPTPNK